MSTAAAASCIAFALDPDPQLVRQSANEVFRATRAGAEVYLRITTAAHRSRQEVLAEIEWMRSLVASGLAVVAPLPSRAGRFVEVLSTPDGETYAVCFARAPGRQAEKRRDYTPAVAGRWAELLAALHAHARAYVPAGPERRPRWDADRVLRTALEADHPETALASDRLQALVHWMRTLPTDAAGFGLTHADLHLGNLSVDGGRVTAFDFDDACQHWFAHDLAVGVTSIRKAAWEHPDVVDAGAVERAFLETYAGSGVLDSAWLAHVPRFVDYRIALSACWASRSFHTGALDADMRAWYRRSLPWWLAQLGG